MALQETGMKTVRMLFLLTGLVSLGAGERVRANPGEGREEGSLIPSSERPPGSVVNPWAPATDLTTLAARTAQRPEGCQGDPLLCWLADQAQREGRSSSLDELKKERRVFLLRQGFFFRDDETGLWVANSHVGLRFRKGPARRDLVSFYFLPQGLELLGKRSENGSPFRIQILRYRPDGTTGVLNFGPQWRSQSPDPSSVVEVDSTSAKVATHSWRITLGRLRVFLDWRGLTVPDSPGQLNVSIELSLPPDTGLTHWRVQVQGRLPQAGLCQVRCPVLPGFGYPGEVDVRYAWGGNRGIVKRGATDVTAGDYPSSQWSLQHVSVSFGPQAVFYAASHDPDSQVKSFRIEPGKEMFLSAYVPNTGVRGQAEYIQPYEVVVGPMEGDWFDAAQGYRQWAQGHAPWASRLLQERTDVCHRMLKVAYWVRCNWMNEEGNDGDETWGFDQRMFCLPPAQTLDWYRNVLKVPDERLGAIHYGWQRELWDTRLPYWTPQGLHIVQELHRQTELGVFTYIYTNPCWYDPEAPGFNETVRQALTRNLDGSPYFEQYNAKMYEINRATPFFRKLLVDLARFAEKLGASGVYYDQLSGLLRGGDYDRAKELPSLGRGGNWLPLARQEALREVRQALGPHFGFTSEFYCETDQHCFDVQSVTTDVAPGEAPLIPAVYSGYLVQHGAGLDHRTRPTTAVFSLGRNFLWGTVHGWTLFATDLRRHYTRRLLAQLVPLRTRLDDFLVYGQMLRPPPFASPPPMISLDDWYVGGQKREATSCEAFEATLWQAADGRRALLVMNYSPEPHRIVFRMGDLALPSPEGIRLLGPSPGARLESSVGKLTLRLPGRQAGVVILPP